MKVIDFAEQDSLISQYMTELRDEKVQKDMLRFRRNLERIGEITAYEISKAFSYKEKENFDVCIEYLASPRLDGKTLILADPMLATGASMELSYRALLTKGEPEHIHVASVIASRKAVDYIREHFPEENTTVWIGAVDPEINAHSYIVPGLGDAGDLAYGIKE